MLGEMAKELLVTYLSGEVGYVDQRAQEKDHHVLAVKEYLGKERMQDSLVVARSPVAVVISLTWLPILFPIVQCQKLGIMDKPENQANLQRKFLINGLEFVERCLSSCKQG